MFAAEIHDFYLTLDNENKLFHIVYRILLQLSAFFILLKIKASDSSLSMLIKEYLNWYKTL